MTAKLRWFLPCAALSLTLDQTSKLVVLHGLAYGAHFDVIDGFFRLTHARNPGGAWSFLASAPDVVRLPLFVGGTLLGLAAGLIFLRRLEAGARLAAAALGMIVGGALGNLADRLVHGAVIDLLDFTLWAGTTWPTFNLADVFIVVGVALLVLDLFGTPRARASS